VGTVLSRILRGVNYFDLRRDVIDPNAIALIGIGESGLWALCAAALDQRPSAVAAVDMPAGVMLEETGSVGPADLAGMLPPRRAAILGVWATTKDAAAFENAYENTGKSKLLRMDGESGDTNIIDTVWWATGKEMQK